VPVKSHASETLGQITSLKRQHSFPCEIHSSHQIPPSICACHLFWWNLCTKCENIHPASPCDTEAGSE